MKTKHFFTLLTLVTLFFAACKKEENPVVPPVTDPTPVPCVVENYISYTNFDGTSHYGSNCDGGFDGYYTIGGWNQYSAGIQINMMCKSDSTLQFYPESVLRKHQIRNGMNQIYWGVYIVAPYNGHLYCSVGETDTTSYYNQITSIESNNGSHKNWLLSGNIKCRVANQDSPYDTLTITDIQYKVPVYTSDH